MQVASHWQAPPTQDSPTPQVSPLQLPPVVPVVAPVVPVVLVAVVPVEVVPVEVVPDVGVTHAQVLGLQPRPALVQGEQSQPVLPVEEVVAAPVEVPWEVPPSPVVCPVVEPPVGPALVVVLALPVVVA